MTKTNPLLLCGLIAGAIAGAPAFAGTVRVTNDVMVQEKTVAADGTTRIALVPAKRVTPGDRVVYRTSYRNEVGQPVEGMIVSNPVPANLVYRGPAEGSPAPEVSTDGKTFAPLAQLQVRAGSATRSALAEDVKVVRWRIASAVPVGGSGQYAFEATLK